MIARRWRLAAERIVALIKLEPAVPKFGVPDKRDTPYSSRSSYTAPLLRTDIASVMAVSIMVFR
jgi:hypothetical protein